MRKCHLNTCPVGVATQDPRLRKRFGGRPEYLVNYAHFIAEELRAIMAELGFRTLDEMVGRADLLRMRDGVDHWKAKSLDFSRIFHVESAGENPIRKTEDQDHGLDGILDWQLLEDCKPASEGEEQVKKFYPIRNLNRTTGAMLSGVIAKRYGLKGLPEGSIELTFAGSAGQSFGAFAVRGLTLVLEGDANDYVGKGLSGGRLIVRPHPEADYDPAENVIVGNTVLYGATSGEAYFSGLAGERFGIRNSGARAVVEGVGDHGCEYMTGGVVAVLGETGVNFAAGMSGGIAYVYDPRQDFDLRCNLAMVDLESVGSEEDVGLLRDLVGRHADYTGSPRAKWMLENWDTALPLFVKVIPMEYRRALGQMAQVDLRARKTAEEMVTHG
jgi:glutamate synthase domain-containing protein 3